MHTSHDIEKLASDFVLHTKELRRLDEIRAAALAAWYKAGQPPNAPEVSETADAVHKRRLLQLEAHYDLIKTIEHEFWNS